MGVLAITGINFDGDMQGHPVGWPDDTPLPNIRVIAERGAPALGVGERAVVRYARLDGGGFEARIIRAVGAAPDRVLGIFRLGPEGGRIEPTDRKARTEYRVAQRDRAGAEDGEIVLAELVSQPRMGLPEAKIVERVGSSTDARAFSLIAIHTHGIPTAFSTEALALADEARPVSLGEREDLRAVPLVTIDGADARDFDDAVFAEPDPDRAGFWHAIVAIADVSWYVRPGDALDRDAHERGNSVYFPDRVVPMLPEALSNELCSLKPEVERACVAVHLYVDSDGRLERHRFCRGLMRSARRYTYEAAQAEHDTAALRPLYGVFKSLDGARLKRGALELDLPERQIVLDEAGRVARVAPRERLDSHRLIEELMIAANVAAAERLEQLHRPCMYRVHDAPDPAKLAALREFLDSIGLAGLRLAKGQAIRPRHFNDILRKAANTPYAPMIHQLVLRSQAQAVYSPVNLGHFGLGLRRYAHFTSPIRRYSDLLVHRALVGDLLGGDAKAFAATGEHVSMTERRASAAERSASDRYLAAFLAERVGASFAARINGVTRAGLFITLNETGADGLIPMRSLGGDYFVHDEAHHRLVGRRTGRVYSLGDPLTARLAEANGATGSLLFALEPVAPDRPTMRRSSRTK